MAYAFGIFVLLGMSALFGHFTYRGLRTGRMPGKFGIIIKKEDGLVFFRFMLASYAGLSLFGAYSAIRVAIIIFSK